MQAPQPWGNPTYYAGQIPSTTMIPTQNFPAYPHLPVIPNTWNINQTAPSLFQYAPGGLLPVQKGMIQKYRNQSIC